MKIETLLANLAQNSGFKDPYGASHFPIYNTATFDLKNKKATIPYTIILGLIILPEMLWKIFLLKLKTVSVVFAPTPELLLFLCF
jgi:cystathionine beta-lyase